MDNYELGAKAYAAWLDENFSSSIPQNPFAIGTTAHREWKQGFDDAEFLMDFDADDDIPF